MSKKDGGPAFPVPVEDFTFADFAKGHPAPGMTLRDWFAGQAIVGIWSCPDKHVSGSFEDLAKKAVLQADALLAELDKP